MSKIKGDEGRLATSAAKGITMKRGSSSDLAAEVWNVRLGPRARLVL
jgi:hypothetical protein